MSTKVHTVTTQQELDSFKEYKQPIIIKFSAQWCGPCKMMIPYFTELSEKYQNITFIEIDIDKSQIISESYKVSSLPTFIVCNDRLQESCRLQGANKSKLLEMIKNIDDELF